MIRTAFSTTATPDWTLERVAACAGECGYFGVELRSFGEGPGDLACDPALTDPAKVRQLFADAGVEPAGVATGLYFHEPVFPPVIGQLLPAAEASVREGRRFVALASAIGAPLVRVYGFEVRSSESRPAAIRRIAARLGRVCDHARNRDVAVVIENGGSFTSAADLAEVIDAVNHPLLGACYRLSEGLRAGDDPEDAIDRLGQRLWAARLDDERAGTPCPLGRGDRPCRAFVEALAACDSAWGTDPWLIYSWDRLWRPELAPAETVLAHAARTLIEWTGGGRLASRHLPARQSAAPAMML